MILNCRRLSFLTIIFSFIAFTSKAQCVSDFEVTTATGETVVNICLGNSSPIVAVAAQIRGFPIMYVLTDDSDVILSSGTNPVFSFAGAPAGVCRIYAATFKGRILNAVGQDLATASLTSFCHGLSRNYVTIIRGSADASTIETTDGVTDTTFCSQDGLDDLLEFSHTMTTDDYVFVITDENGLILGTTDAQNNFEGAPAGTCYVYGLSYDGTLLAAAGLFITDNLATACYALSDNRIEVTRVTTDPGMITTIDGTTQEILCVGDSIPDVLTFASPGADTMANYVYIITNASDTIIGLPDSTIVDFENAGVGICRVYGVAYSGTLNANIGMQIADITSGGACQGITLNYVEVIRTSPVEGRIETLSGDTVVYTCPGDSIGDIVTVNILSGANAFIFIITDENGNVLGMSVNQAIDFEGAGAGVCRIYRFTYTGDLIIMMGDNIFSDPISDGCYVRSDNFVEVRRAIPSADFVSTFTGQQELNLCVGDGKDDIYQFISHFNDNLPFTLVVTDDSNKILRLLAVGEAINFDGAGSGTCRVYGLSYHGDLLANIGDDVGTADLATACWELTSAPVEVNRTNVDPGTLFTQYGTTVYTCPGDGNPDQLILTRQTDADTSIVFITDDQGVVLAIVDSDTVDVEGAGEGECRIWGLSFEGQVLFGVGDTIIGQDLASGCYSLTDPVIVIRRVPYTAPLVTITGDTIVEFCTGNGIDDLLILDYAPAADFPIEYVITDTFGFILNTTADDTINFDGVPTGICRVYGVAYTGFFTGAVGQNIGSSDLSDDCYAISINYIQVIRKQPEGGSVSLIDGGNEIHICPGNGIDDIVKFIRSGGTDDAFTFIVTDESNVILAIPAADSANFEFAPIGICRVWGVAYTGNFIGEVGDTASIFPLSDQCFGLTSDFISVIRDTAEAGTITTIQGDTLVNVSTTDTISDLVTVVAHDASMANSRFVITGADDLILAILNGNLVDFGQIPAAEYRIYHISYTGNLLISGGFRITTDPISDDCYDLSTNFVRVIVSDNFTDDGDQDLTLESLFAQDESPNLRIFPNPVRDRLKFTQNHPFDRVLILNAMGQQVAMKNINGVINNSIDISGFNTGLYLLVTYFNGKIIDRQQFLVH